MEMRTLFFDKCNNIVVASERDSGQICVCLYATDDHQWIYNFDFVIGKRTSFHHEARSIAPGLVMNSFCRF